MTSIDSRKIPALAGLIFAVTFVVGLLLMSSGDAETSDEYVKYFNDSGHQTQTVIGYFTMVVAAITFVIFLVGVRARLSTNGPATGNADTLVFAFGIVVAALLVVGGAAIAAISGEMKFSDQGAIPQDGAVLSALESVGFAAILIGAGLFAAACATTTAIASLKSAAFPRWHAIIGLLCAVILLLGFAFVPLIALPIWVVATGVALLRGGAGPQSLQPAEAATP